MEGAPDLVVEVTSPATVEGDRGIKLERYRHYGVREYWIVDPGSETIERWRFAMGGTEPEVFDRDEVLRWEPGGGGLVLEIRVGGLVG